MARSRLFLCGRLRGSARVTGETVTGFWLIRGGRLRGSAQATNENVPDGVNPGAAVREGLPEWPAIEQPGVPCSDAAVYDGSPAQPATRRPDVVDVRAAVC